MHKFKAITERYTPPAAIPTPPPPPKKSDFKTNVNMMIDEIHDGSGFN